MRMQRRLWGIWVLSLLLPCVEGAAENRRVYKVDTLAMNSIVQKYSAALAALSHDTTAFPLDTGMRYAPPFFRLLTPGTLYDAPMRQAFSVSWTPALPAKADSVPSLMGEGLKDRGRSVLEEGNRMLMQAYVRVPWLISLTERDLDEAGGLKEEVLPELPEISRLAGNEMDLDLARDVDTVRLVVRRPNFWKFRGDYSFQFTQNYFSENWYQGGDNNYTMLALATMEANFNNKEKIQWDNKLEMRLGFQTSKTDEKHKVKTNDDLLRFTTKIGYKATTHWFYTLQVQAYTQFYPSYNANSDVVSSDFMSPFNLVVSLGMDYKLELKRFKGSANLSPVAYNFRSVSRKSLYGNFGLDPGRSMYNNFGPNITVNYSWEIWKNIKWDSRIYWFSNMEMTDVEWENTFTFTINKYLNSKLFLYPRIDDSSENYRNEDKKFPYLMFKEWFSLGVNYSF